MDLKDTITKWHTAMCLLDENHLPEAVAMLLTIRSPSAKILHNVGCIQMLQSLYSEAIHFFSGSIEQDKYLALSLLQRGICYFKTQRYDRAELDFLTAQSLCPSDGINYKQLGADVVLTPGQIGDFVQDARDTYTGKKVGQLPELSSKACIFWPPKKMVENLVKQDFLGKAKVISSTEERDIVYAGKLEPSSHTSLKATQHSSRPSPPALPHSRRIVTPGGAEVAVPPHPRRPPPPLPGKSTGRAKLCREKSRSAEDILDSDRDFGRGGKTANGSHSSSRLSWGQEQSPKLGSVAVPSDRTTKGRNPQKHSGASSGQATNTRENNLPVQGVSNLNQGRMPCNAHQYPKPSKPGTPSGNRLLPHAGVQNSAVLEGTSNGSTVSVRELVSKISSQTNFTQSPVTSAPPPKPPKPPRPPPPPPKVKK